VDNLEAQGQLNIKNPNGYPAIYIKDASKTEGTLTAPTGQGITLGHWDANTQTFTSRMRISENGKVTIGSVDDYQIGSENPAFQVHVSLRLERELVPLIGEVQQLPMLISPCSSRNLTLSELGRRFLPMTNLEQLNGSEMMEPISLRPLILGER
jgi:hypothetical protein